MKAILVIDVNEKDIGRKVNYVSVQGGGLSYIVGTINEDVVIKSMPQKKDIDKTLEFGGYENIIQESLARGYNACLEEITK